MNQWEFDLPNRSKPLAAEIDQLRQTTAFQDLFIELESVYLHSGEPDPGRTAFRDALFAFLCERDVLEGGR